MQSTEQLEKARARIEKSFLGPFLDYAASLDGAEHELDDSLTVLRALDTGQAQSDLQAKIQLNRGN